MSGKNRRNNQQRQQESDNTIAYVQCDGLVSNFELNSIRKSMEMCAKFVFEKIVCMAIWAE